MPTATRLTSTYFEIRKSPIQGRGAFAIRRIRAGTRVIEYTGEHITPEEADARYEDASMTRHHTFLFILDDHTVIDAARGGNASKYINHSCEPNCQAVIEDGHIFIEAIRNIQPGVELSYDYAYERVGGDDAELEKRYVCRCGSTRCRGTIVKPRKVKRTRRARR